MKLDHNKSELRSIVGSIFTMLYFTIFVTYSVLKFEVFVNKTDVDIMMSTEAEYFTPDDQFGFEQGLNLAVAFTAYDSVREPILDESIGRLVFNKYEWGTDEDGNFFSIREEL